MPLEASKEIATSLIKEMLRIDMFMFSHDLVYLSNYLSLDVLISLPFAGFLSTFANKCLFDGKKVNPYSFRRASLQNKNFHMIWLYA